MRILLVEDDAMIGESLSHALRKNGYAVDWAHDGAMAEESLRMQEYGLMLLDLGLPRLSGIAVLRTLRADKSTLPVIILTARDAVADRVQGLDAGADDYLVKPFALEELEARIRVRMRRQAGSATPLLQAGAASLNTVTRELTYGTNALTLSAREYALMFALMEYPGRIRSRLELEERLYGWNEEVSSNAVEVHVHQLRKKLGSGVIRNIRGMGYMVVGK